MIALVAARRNIDHDRSLSPSHSSNISRAMKACRARTSSDVVGRERRSGTGGGGER